MPEQLIQRQQVTLTPTIEPNQFLLEWKDLRGSPWSCTVTIHTPSVTDVTVGVTQDSQQKSRQSSECVCCGVSLADGEVSTDAPELPCGCRWCWHCGDNRGRYEGHDPKACSEQSQQNSRHSEAAVNRAAKAAFERMRDVDFSFRAVMPRSWEELTEASRNNWRDSAEAALNALPDAQGSVTEQSQQKSRQGEKHDTRADETVPATRS